MIFSLFCAFIALALILADQLTKALAEAFHVFQSDYFLGLIRLNYVENTGLPWGWLGDNPEIMKVITAFTVVMMVGIVVLFFTVFKKNSPARVALVFIEAGGIGNLIDRVVFGSVRDFVDVSPTGFGICNLADFFITFGAVALFIILLFVGKDAVFPLGKNKKAQEEEGAAGNDE